MRIFNLLTLFALLCLSSCSSKQGPSTFENGIFRRDVAQVSLNAGKISRIAKESERNLEEMKIIKERVTPPTQTQEEEKAPETETTPKENHSS